MVKTNRLKLSALDDHLAVFWEACGRETLRDDLRRAGFVVVRAQTTATRLWVDLANSGAAPVGRGFRCA